jgi:uncharacterized protein (DUF697 family)/tellurite resistance protein
MTDAEQRALIGISLMAAFADGSNADAERDRIRELLESFKNPALNALELYREVLMKRVQVTDLARQLTTAESRLLAYEMALGVCDADGHANDAERAFLSQLQRELGIAEGTAAPLQREAEEIVSSAVPPVLGSAPPRTSGVSRGGPAVSAGAMTASNPEIESAILNHAILAGALELLPGSLATMAIVPVQMRLVYRIGQQYGHSLDRGHIGEFLAAAGIGMTSQVLEGYATKFMKGLLGKMAGGLGRGLAGAVMPTAMAFGTTWALGQLAHRYYAGGRSLSGLQLKEGFQSLMGQAQTLQQQYLPQIQQRSRGLNLSEVVRLAGRS